MKPNQRLILRFSIIFSLFTLLGTETIGQISSPYYHEETKATS